MLRREVLNARSDYSWIIVCGHMTGGFDLGFARAGITTLWDVEIDPYCQAVIKKNFPETEIFGDIREVGKHNLKRVDILSAGFPCTDISVAGKQAGIADGTRSGLWSEVPRIVSELRPQFVVIENVANLVNLGLERVLCDLAEIGYDAEWQIISANDVSAPHLRKRIWIVAYPTNSGLEAKGPTFAEKEGSANSQRNARELPRRLGGLGRKRQGPDVAYPLRSGGDPGTERDRRQEGSNFGGRCERAVVADPEVTGLEGYESERDKRPGRRTTKYGGGEAISNPIGINDDGRRHESSEICWEQSGQAEIFRGEHWFPEPNLGELADGLPLGLASQFTTRDIPGDYPIPRIATKIPDRVNKLKGLGNAVVPQIPEIIGARLVEIINAP